MSDTTTVSAPWYKQAASWMGLVTFTVWFIAVCITIIVVKLNRKKNITFKPFTAPAEDDNTNHVEYYQRGYKKTWLSKLLWVYWVGFPVKCIFELIILIIEVESGGKIFGPKEGTFERSAMGYLILVFLCNITILFLVLYRWDLKIQLMTPVPLEQAEYVQIRPSHKGEMKKGFLSASNRAAFTSSTGRGPLPETRLIEVKRQGDISFIEYGCIRCLFKDDTQTFTAPPLPSCDPVEAKNSLELGGLSQNTVDTRTVVTGLNVITVPVPHPLEALLEEMLTPVMVYQLTCIFVYYAFSWGLPTFWLLSNVIVSAYTTFAVTLPQRRKLGEMAKTDAVTSCMRQGQWQEKNAADLVPGDIVALYSGQIAPCDVVVLQGQAVVSEAMLTGEPKPIVKFNYDYLSDANRDSAPWTAADNKSLVSKHVVHAGCPITQANGAHTGNQRSDNACIGMVLSTGAQTAKGKLVRMVLFPTPAEDVFDKQLTLVFLFVFLFCCILASSIAFYDFGHWSITAFSMLAFLAQCISPNLHASLKWAQVLGTKRLKEKGIVVVEPETLCRAGKTHVMCFDKTGTITKEELDLHGVIPVEKGRPDGYGEVKFNNDTWTNSLAAELQIAFGCCHTLSKLQKPDGSTEMLGNQVELKMFEASGWHMHDRYNYSSTNNAHRVGKVQVARQMAFDQSTQTSGVVVRLPNGEQKAIIKGSFEKMAGLSGTHISNDLRQKVAELSKKQYYVITIGYKDLSSNLDVNTVSREQIEHGLNICGLLLFRNDVKEDSAQAIDELKKGATRVVMITGDSVEAGIGIARAVNILPPKDDSGSDDEIPSSSSSDQLLPSLPRPAPSVAPGVRVYQGDVHQAISPDTKVQQEEVLWQDIDAPNAPLLTTIDIMALDPKNVELAISMPAFRNLNASGKTMYELAPLVRVFGRMRPNDKSMAIRLLQNHNLVVGMCGDGGNDTAALRTAHFGYALSDADASLVAPISSKDPSLLRVNDTLCAARATLATSLGIFMWSAVLGGVYPAFKIVNIWTNGNMLGEVPGIFLEYAIETMLVFLMALSKPLNKLTGYRPTQRLLGLNVGLRVLVPIVIWSIFLVFTRVVLGSFDWFEQFNARDMQMTHKEQYTVRSDAYQVEIDVFRMYCFYTAMALIYSMGRDVRQPLYRNWALMGWCTFVFGWMLFLILQQNTTIGCFMRFNCDSKTTLAMKDDGFASFWNPFLNYKVAGGCVYGPQIKHWVEAAGKGGASYEFPDHSNQCHIGEAGYAQDLWGPNSPSGTTCVGPNNCLPASGKILAIGSGVLTIACCIGASFLIAGVRLRYKKQFHRL